MPHYFSEHQDSKIKYSEIQGTLPGLKFIVAPGIFSHRRVDPGSSLLIDKAVLPEQGLILDLGCGYGAIGISLAKHHPKLGFTLTDINRRAIACSKMNAKMNHVKNVSVKWGDLYNGLPRFDAILCNPPQSAGKKLCFSMIDQSIDHLNPGGSFQLVARHQKGGKDLKKRMEENFGNVEEVAKRSGYRIYLSVRPR
ncbi:MAG: methyltransferase [Nanoarchaeota archaeon]|nr:methyltransferase [Nanoarchaeota archaeon]